MITNPKHTRRTAAALLLALAWAWPALGQDLRIGYILPATGGFAQQGADMKAGFDLYLAEVKANFAGAKVTVIYEDDESVVANGKTKAEKLIASDKVHIIMGGVLAPTGYALAQVSSDHKIPYVMPVAAADDVTQRDKAKYPYLVRTGWSGSQTTHALGQWACDQKLKRVTTVAADYAFGWESTGGFQDVFEACGGKVVQKVWPPNQTKDFGPFLAQIKPDVDAVFVVMVGAMIPQFPKQFRAAGLKMPIIGQGTSTDEASLPFMSEDAIGMVTALQYSAAIPTPENEAFVKKFRAATGKLPGYYAETNYTSGKWLHEAMKKTGGKWPGAEKFVQLMRETQLAATPRGPVKLDDMGSTVQNIYIRKVEKTKRMGYANDEMWNVVVKTYPNVSQFWTTPREKYLAAPLYNREYPPCKHCE